MREFQSVDLPLGSYTYYLRESFSDLKMILSSLNLSNRKFCVVTDSNVNDLYIVSLKRNLYPEFQFETFVMPAGESSKNLETVQKLYGFLIERDFNRDDILLALGGGVVGDLTGYVAATYMRGMNYIQLPTTLLAAIDSSIGGKTAVDFNGYKNMVGAFYNPLFIYHNVSTLRTLEEIEYNSGLAEVLKIAMILDKSFYVYLHDHSEAIRSTDNRYTFEMVRRSVFLKDYIVKKDPHDQGIRGILNFGHTIGHAIESLCNYKYPHGNCVARGMKYAILISKNMGYLTETNASYLLDLLELYNYETHIPPNITHEEIMEAIKKDKKQGTDGLKFILLDDIGHAFIYPNMAPEDIIRGLES
jgi:3-dehydroquinate synthase